MTELPKIKRGRKTFYFDARLSELRNVKNPHDRIELSEAECMALSWKTKPQKFAKVWVGEMKILQDAWNSIPNDDEHILTDEDYKKIACECIHCGQHYYYTAGLKCCGKQDFKRRNR